LLPLIGPFPVTWHTRAMRALLIRFNSEFERQIHLDHFGRPERLGP